ncbi:MAG: hypothetical protein ACRDN8_16885 [Thermoleophilaceae bacterium]
MLLARDQLPAWNRISGSDLAWRPRLIVPDDTEELFTGKVDSLLQARRSLRELARNAAWETFEERLHSGRFEAAARATVEAVQLSDEAILKMLDEIAERQRAFRDPQFGEDLDRIRQERYLLEKAALIIGDAHPLRAAQREAWTAGEPVPVGPVPPPVQYFPGSPSLRESPVWMRTRVEAPPTTERSPLSPLFAGMEGRILRPGAFPRLAPTVDSPAEEQPAMETSRPPQSDPMTTLTIEARDLDTDARKQTVIDAVPPLGRSRQRAALTEAVGRLFPHARLRSFSNGAATFLDTQHLIVASYAKLPPANRRGATDDAGEQQNRLFAA